jgi:hypothetical protein
MGKNKSKTPEAVNLPKAKPTGLPVHGLYGIFLLIVSASVIYANYRVFFGVEDMVARVMLIPSTLAVAVFLVYKAAK